MPTLTLSIAALRAASACDLDERIADLRTVRPDVSEDEPVPLTVWWSLPSTIIADRWWSLRVAAPTDTAHQVAVKAAAMAARRVLRLTPDAHRQVCEAEILAAEAWADQPAVYRAYAGGAAAAAAAADAAARAAAAAADAADALAYVAEREAQRADLDRLIMEASR